MNERQTSLRGMFPGTAALLAMLMVGGTVIPQRVSCPEDKSLSQRESLQMKVSVVCRAQPLERVVADLAKDARVSLGLEDPVRKRAFRLTAHVEDLPLWQVMQALEDLFQVQWRGNGAEYTLSNLPRSAVERDLARLGDPEWLSYNLGSEEYEQRQRLANAIYQSFTPEQRRTALKEGVPLSSLSEEHRTQLARAIEQTKGLDRLVRARRALPDALSRCVLKATVPKLPANYSGYQDRVAAHISVMQGTYEVTAIPWLDEKPARRPGPGARPAR